MSVRLIRRCAYISIRLSSKAGSIAGATGSSIVVPLAYTCMHSFICASRPNVMDNRLIRALIIPRLLLYYGYTCSRVTISLFRFCLIHLYALLFMIKPISLFASTQFLRRPSLLNIKLTSSYLVYSIAPQKVGKPSSASSFPDSVLMPCVLHLPN